MIGATKMKFNFYTILICLVLLFGLMTILAMGLFAIGIFSHPSDNPIDQANFVAEVFSLLVEATILSVLIGFVLPERTKKKLEQSENEKWNPMRELFFKSLLRPTQIYLSTFTSVYRNYENESLVEASFYESLPLAFDRSNVIKLQQASSNYEAELLNSVEKYGPAVNSDMSIFVANLISAVSDISNTTLVLHMTLSSMARHQSHCYDNNGNLCLIEPKKMNENKICIKLLNPKKRNLVPSVVISDGASSVQPDTLSPNQEYNHINMVTVDALYQKISDSWNILIKTAKKRYGSSIIQSAKVFPPYDFEDILIIYDKDEFESDFDSVAQSSLEVIQW